MENDFQKNIKDWRSIRMSESEKSRMLQNILRTPVPSPYVFHFHLRPTLAMCLVAVLVFTGVVRASSSALPGEILYPIKTNVVESVIDVVKSTPAQKIVWEEEKINRRIAEAEALVVQNKLDDKKLRDLEKKIEKSSQTFARNVEIVASSTTKSSASAKEKSDTLKSEFRKKISGEVSTEVATSSEDSSSTNSSDVSYGEHGQNLLQKNLPQVRDAQRNSSDDQKDKIQKLRDAAIKALDKKRTRREATGERTSSPLRPTSGSSGESAEEYKTYYPDTNSNEMFRD